jgi:hypothetical protein
MEIMNALIYTTVIRHYQSTRRRKGDDHLLRRYYWENMIIENLYYGKGFEVHKSNYAAIKYYHLIDEKKKWEEG